MFVSKPFGHLKLTYLVELHGDLEFAFGIVAVGGDLGVVDVVSSSLFTVGMVKVKARVIGIYLTVGDGR